MSASAVRAQSAPNTPRADALPALLGQPSPSTRPSQPTSSTQSILSMASGRSTSSGVPLTSRETSSTSGALSAWDTGVAISYSRWKDPLSADLPVEERKETPLPVHPDLLNWNPGSAVLLPMEEQVIALNTTPDSVLLIDMAVELSRNSAIAEIKSQDAFIREQILEIIESIPPDHVRTLAGKLTIKRGILRLLNSSIKSGAARRIYFTKFQILEHFDEQ